MNFDEIKADIKDFTLGLAIVCIYFFLYFSGFIRVPLELLGIDIDSMSNLSRSIYSVIYELIILAIIVFLTRKGLVRDWEDFKKNKDIYFKKYFKYWFLLLALMMASNYIVMYITEGGIAENEQLIRDTMKVSPIYIYVSGVLIAPFLEELVFRFGFRKIFKTDWLFIIITGFVFGALHVVTGNSSYLYIIPYALPGIVFGYLYVKSKNIFTTIGIHLFHNGLLMSLQFLLLFFELFIVL